MFLDYILDQVPSLTDIRIILQRKRSRFAWSVAGRAILEDDRCDLFRKCHIRVQPTRRKQRCDKHERR